MFDSIAEKLAAQYLNLFGFKRYDKLSDFSLIDSNNNSFRFKPDFHCSWFNIYLEFKSAPLNSKKNVETANKAMQRVQNDIAAGYKNERDMRYFQLENQWSHSYHKQKIVQDHYTSERFIICFSDKALKESEAKKYRRAGLIFITMSELPSFLSKLIAFQPVYSRLAASLPLVDREVA